MPYITVDSASLAKTVNLCVALRAQIDELTQQKKELEAELIDSGLTQIEGNLHVATISRGLSRTTIDWKTIAGKFEPSRQLVAAHTSEGQPFDQVRYSARKLPA